MERQRLGMRERNTAAPARVLHTERKRPRDPNGAAATVVSLSLPAGHYTLSASVETADGDHNVNTDCSLRVNGSSVDSVATTTESLVSVPTTSGATAVAQGMANLGSAGTADLSCSADDDGDLVEDATLLATQVSG